MYMDMDSVRDGHLFKWANATAAASHLLCLLLLLLLLLCAVHALAVPA